MSATNHLLMITGKRQTGKTRELVDLINDAADVNTNQVFFVNREPLPTGVTLHAKAKVITGNRDRSPVALFLDQLPLGKIDYPTHVFFDNVPQGCLNELIHLGASVPGLNIAFVVQDTTK